MAAFATGGPDPIYKYSAQPSATRTVGIDFHLPFSASHATPAFTPTNPGAATGMTLQQGASHLYGNPGFAAYGDCKSLSCVLSHLLPSHALDDHSPPTAGTRVAAWQTFLHTLDQWLGVYSRQTGGLDPITGQATTGGGGTPPAGVVAYTTRHQQSVSKAAVEPGNATGVSVTY
jgi:hypothetical protein